MQGCPGAPRGPATPVDALYPLVPPPCPPSPGTGEPPPTRPERSGGPAPLGCCAITRSFKPLVSGEAGALPPTPWGRYQAAAALPCPRGTTSPRWGLQPLSRAQGTPLPVLVFVSRVGKDAQGAPRPRHLLSVPVPPCRHCMSRRVCDRAWRSRSAAARGVKLILALNRIFLKLNYLK